MATRQTYLVSQAQTAALQRRVVVYIFLIIIAEAFLVVAGPVISLAAHGILLVVLAIQAASVETQHRQVFTALMLHPLMRVISVGLPTSGLPPLVQYVMVGLPLLVGIVLVIRSARISTSDLGLVGKVGWQPFAIGLLGWPLGLIGALIIRPEPAVTTLTPVNLMVAIIVITVFSSSVEELLFRGVLQTTLQQYFGNSAIFFSTLLFVSAYLGTLSIPYIIFIGLVGAGFALVVQRSGSLWGVLIAHSLFKCGALLIWPFFLR